MRSVPGAGSQGAPPPPPDRFPFLHLPSHQPWGSARRAGRRRGGCRAAPAQKAESSSEEARFVIAVPTVRWRSKWEPYTAELSSRPGPARPHAMEFLWAPLLGLCCSLAAADRHIVFWNSSNPKFREEDFTVHVRLNDYLDIICPHYEDDSVADAAMERYTLYMVEQQEYTACQPQSKDQVRWKCNQPSAKHGPEKLSEKFQRFTPFTLGKEFKEGHSYYYISKPIYHQESQCLKLKVTVDGKISECQALWIPPSARAEPADDPEVQVLHSIGYSAAPRLFPLVWAVLLLPLLLLQTQ
ncbi:Efna1 [Lemmus lemmus]